MPTLFDSSQIQKQKKTEELQKQLQEIIAEEHAQNTARTLPERQPIAEDAEELRGLMRENPGEKTRVVTTNENQIYDLQHAVEESEIVETEPIQAEVAEPPDETQELPASFFANLGENSSQEEGEETHMHHREPTEYSEVLREMPPSNGLFSAFAVQPPDSGFDSQHGEEKVLLLLRQHPIVNMRWILITFVLFLAPFLIFPILPVFQFLPDRFGFFALLGWFLFIAAFIIESFLSWYYNIYIITDERIIDIDFISLVFKEVSEAKIEKIEDVTATTAGFFGAVFDYGTIAVQTAAEKRQFEFDKVPQPTKVAKFINELVLEEERERIEGRVM